jgi:sterol desaturase/sphingolipid hydroxylase (fatty acid hydroxylase superfamily)
MRSEIEKRERGAGFILPKEEFFLAIIMVNSPMDAAAVKLFQCALDLAKSFAWYGGMALALYSAERRWPAGPRTTVQEQGFNFLIALLLSLAMTATNAVAPLAPGLVSKLGISRPFLADRIPHTVVGWIAGALLYAFVWDFFQYWFHRLQHQVGVLWFMHALHHDSRTLNTTDALRNTLWGGFFQSVFIGVPILIVGANQVLHLYAGILLFSCWGFYNHANIRISHGPLTAVLSGPHFHRIHHGMDRRYHNKNFAAFFPVIDIIFATYEVPVPGEVPVTGLSDRMQARGGLVSATAAMLGRTAGHGIDRDLSDPKF